MNMLDTEFDEYSSHRVEDLVRTNMFDSLLKRLPKKNDFAFCAGRDSHSFDYSDRRNGINFNRARKAIVRY